MFAFRFVFAFTLTAASVLAGSDWSTATKRARAAVVDVLVEDQHHGTGFFVDASGLALTCAHVVAVGERRIELLMADGSRVRATVVARDLGHDLALLRAAERVEAYPTVSIAEEPPGLGEDIAVYGTPLHRRGLLLFGRVARSEIGYEYLGTRQHYVGCRYVSGLAPSGTSGGPWLNDRGEVVGVQIGGVSLSSGWQGISFIAPTAKLRALVEAEEERATPSIRLAVEETWQQGDDFFEDVPPGTDGLVVKVLDEKGPAAEAGVQLGDVIVTVDDAPARFVVDLLSRVRAKMGDESISLELLGRNGDANRIVKVPIRILLEGTAKSPEG